ncbi:substrate-binding domain-containing protein [Halobacillus litoralis]|uniref:Substrate-binding domain-containing protein n=1 Tax=Halobacillus litoralis TaxID=45668 RepID=A0A845DX67_9BACI|nr:MULTISPECIES: LacI family DNA-binding transcriptional regulator [Halobacillus]MYL18657.1 substrate-binding domain-containing protein [Halobacillus litoralis]MYL31596.1 substrate-binding domain-containing protein [Halobacillus halophilus]
MATIKDIARTAGVSVTTVSRALNGYSDVSEKTRKKIKKIAEELEYSPNSLARSLVMNQTKTIGLLVSGITREGSKDNIVYEVLTGINEYCGQVEYDLVLFNTNTSKQKQKSYTQLCRERRVDGVIIQGIKTEDPYLMEVVESDIPCVLVDIPIEGESVGYVSSDNIKGAFDAVTHLIERNHRKIAMVNGHEQAFVSQERLKGFRQGMIDNGLDIREEWIVNGHFEEERAEEAAFQLLSEYEDITAVVCASDLMALGVMRAARRIGKRIPEDLSVTGYDDIILASYVTPALTTVGQDTFEIGSSAAALLINMLEGKTQNRHMSVGHQLEIRQSTRFN